MGAKNTTSTGRKNYYTISFGHLSTSLKSLPDGVDEKTNLATLKARMQENDNLFLSKSYIQGEGEYPYKVFYQEIKGQILGIKSVDTDGFGKKIEITLLDEDLETSIIQAKLYSKYAEDFLNRFLGVTTLSDLVLRPYAVPSEFTLDSGKVINFYNMGVIIYENGEKINKSIKAEELPEKDTYMDQNGEEKKMNKSRVEFLLEKANEKFSKLEKLNHESAAVKQTATSPIQSSIEDFNDDDLPF